MGDKTKAETTLDAAASKVAVVVDPRDAEIARLRAALEATAAEKATLEKSHDEAKAYAGALETELDETATARRKDLGATGPSTGDLAQLGEVMADAFVKAQTKVAETKGRNRRNFDGPGGTHLVAPEHRGTITYIVGPGGHVRGNRQYKNGQLVTVTNERPAKDWVKYDPLTKGPAVETPVAPEGRANDRNVG